MTMIHRLALTTVVALACVAPRAGAVEPWATYRGNAQRTGNADGLAGPASPRVLWVHRAQEHFIASPVPAGDQLLLSGLGGFNGTQSLHLRATSRGDLGPNKASTVLDAVRLPGVTNTIGAQVRWLRGKPEILFRYSGNWLHLPPLAHENEPGPVDEPGEVEQRAARLHVRVREPAGHLQRGRPFQRQRPHLAGLRLSHQRLLRLQAGIPLG